LNKGLIATGPVRKTAFLSNGAGILLWLAPLEKKLLFLTRLMGFIFLTGLVSATSAADPNPAPIDRSIAVNPKSPVTNGLVSSIGAGLGDESDGSLAIPVHLIPLLNEDGEKITPEDKPLLPFSTRQTCGACHSYNVINRGWHFNAPDPNIPPGRPAQPWILVDTATGTQIPLSHRPWPGTFRPEQLGLTPRKFLRLFGRHIPGGGVGEQESTDPDEITREFISGKLEVNCMSCHDADPAHDQAEYAIQTARENFQWAAAATCGFATVSGSAKDMPDTYDPLMPRVIDDPKLTPPSVTYRKEVFDSKNQVFFNVVREVPNERCYFCHSNMYLVNKGTEKWQSDQDVHLAAGLACVDCHRNGMDHNITRGYEGEESISKNPLATTSSCQGCHLEGKSSSLPVAGRLGAPVPKHPGIPPVHFDKLACTACHSGPWPAQETILVKTSRAHRLGTTNVNKSPEVLPHIVAPVFAKQQGMIAGYRGQVLVMGSGKIAPYKLIWPSFWGVLKDQTVTPIDIESVRQNVGEIFAKEKLSVSDGWLEIRDEHITEALKKLSSEKPVEGRPVYIAGGKLYYLDDTGKLCQEEGHQEAQACLWAIAHDVRPAAQALGARYCTDCHATDAPFFFGAVTIDSPVVSQQNSFKKMFEFQDINPRYAWAFAFSFVFRPWLKVIALGSAAIIAAVLLLYSLKALTSVVKVLAGENK
jgi:hypothetical protein